MVWARLDDEILDNQKVARTGALGFALHAAAVTWCCRNLTDGVIPLPKVRTLLDLAELGVDARDVAARLLREGLWEGIWLEEGDRKELIAYRLHDFLDYNPSKADVLAERARKRGSRKPPVPETSSVRLSDGDAAAPSTAPSAAPSNGIADGPVSPLSPSGSDLDLPDVRPCARVALATLETPMAPWAVRQVEAIVLANLLPPEVVDGPNAWGKYVAKCVDDGTSLSEPRFHGFMRSWVANVKKQLAREQRLDAERRAVGDAEARRGMLPEIRPAPELPPEQRITPQQAQAMVRQALGAL